MVKVMNKAKDINPNEIYKWHEDIKIKWVKGLMQNGMMWNLAQDYALYAEFHKRKGDP